MDRVLTKRAEALDICGLKPRDTTLRFQTETLLGDDKTQDVVIQVGCPRAVEVSPPYTAVHTCFCSHDHAGIT